MKKGSGLGWFLTIVGFAVLVLGCTGLVLKLTMTVQEREIRLAISIGDILNYANILKTNPLLTQGTTIRLFLIQNRYLLMIAGAVLQIAGGVLRASKKRR